MLIKMRSSFKVYILEAVYYWKEAPTVHISELCCTGSQCPEGASLSVTHNYLCHLKVILSHSQPPKQRSTEQSHKRDVSVATAQLTPLAHCVLRLSGRLNLCTPWMGVFFELLRSQLSSFGKRCDFFLTLQICLGVSSCRLWGAPSNWACRMSGWSLGNYSSRFTSWQKPVLLSPSRRGGKYLWVLWIVLEV